MCRLVLTIILSSLVLFRTEGGSASQFYPQDLSTTLEGANNIIRGKVGASRSEWSKTPEGNQGLFTYTEVEVRETLKGKTQSKKVLIRELGGEKNGMTMSIPGTVQLTKGEDVVLLLGSGGMDQNSETYPIMNMSFGKLVVTKDENGKEILKGPALNANPPSGEKYWGILELKSLIANPRSVPPNLMPKVDVKDNSAGDYPSRASTSKSGLLSDTGKPIVTTLPTETIREKNGSGSRDSSSDDEKRLPNRVLIIGSLIGVALFLRSYLKKR